MERGRKRRSIDCNRRRYGTLNRMRIFTAGSSAECKNGGRCGTEGRQQRKCRNKRHCDGQRDKNRHISPDTKTSEQCANRCTVRRMRQQRPCAAPDFLGWQRCRLPSDRRRCLLPPLRVHGPARLQEMSLNRVSTPNTEQFSGQSVVSILIVRANVSRWSAYTPAGNAHGC